ncbi:MAG: DNA polymerase I [Clostridia bacterium]|nr:DNA polymerase I [Clostridia bacterium]
MENKEKILVIDGNSIMNRAFYGIRLLSVKDGTYTNAVYGFLNIFYMMESMLKPDYVAVAFDISAPTFRHKMYDEYKAGRRSMPDELRPQMSLIKDVLRAMNIPILELEGYEADDILGTVAKRSAAKDIVTYILTGDKDSLQLVSEMSNVVMPGKNGAKTEYTIYNPETLMEAMGVKPYQIIELKALMGDKSDNIPGVPKVGEKTALTLLNMCDNIENLYNNIETIDVSDKLRANLIENKEMAFLSKTLATINTDVPIDLDYEALRVKDVNLEEVTKLFTRLEFKKFLDRYLGGKEVVNVNGDFFSGLANTKFVNLNTKEDVKEALNTLSPINNTKLPFIFLDSKFESDKLKNTLIFSIANNIYTIKITDINAKSVLEEFCSYRCEKIGYNIKSVLNLAFRNNIRDIYGFNDDLMIMYYLINTADNNQSIDKITYEVLNANFPTLNKETKKVEQTSMFDMFDDSPVKEETLDELTDNEKEVLFAYINVIVKTEAKLKETLHEMGLDYLYNEVEMPLVETLANIEANGMYVDKVKLKEFGEYIEKNISELTAKIYELAGEEFNINSPMQLGKILFEKLEIEYPKKTKSNYSTDKEILETVQDKHEIVPLVLEYRTLAKLKSTYIDSLIDVIDRDSRIHTTFMQTVTATGRLSSVEPNLQNIPVRTDLGSRIRECFVAEKEGYKIVDADYSQIELRVLADMSGDPTMINAYTNGDDIHSITASQVFNVPLEEVTKELRSKAKAVNFGIVYGISDFGLAKNINVSRWEAKEYIENYFRHYSSVEKYMKSLIESGLETGYATTKYGRKRKVLELKSANYNTRMFGERVAMNMPIQGTAADIMKIAMNNLYKRFKELNLEAKIIMQVHDELLVEAKDSEVEIVKNTMKEVMESAVKLNLPLEADVNVGLSWMEAK